MRIVLHVNLRRVSRMNVKPQCKIRANGTVQVSQILRGAASRTTSGMDPMYVRVGLENYPRRLPSICSIYVDYRLPAIIVQRPCPNDFRTLAVTLFEELTALCQL